VRASDPGDQSGGQQSAILFLGKFAEAVLFNEEKRLHEEEMSRVVKRGGNFEVRKSGDKSLRENELARGGHAARGAFGLKHHVGRTFKNLLRRPPGTGPRIETIRRVWIMLACGVKDCDPTGHNMRSPVHFYLHPHIGRSSTHPKNAPSAAVYICAALPHPC